MSETTPPDNPCRDSKERSTLVGVGPGVLSILTLCTMLARSIFAIIGIGVVAVWLGRPVSSAGFHTACRAQCKNNLRQIGFAIHKYHDRWGCFPPAYVSDKSGHPLYSWRVLILPYLDQQPLYNRFHLDEPWDSPHNVKLLDARPNEFCCPLAASVFPDNKHSHYAAVIGPHCVFSTTGPVSISDITDGTSNTLGIGEIFSPGIPWTKPEDVTLNTTTGVNTRCGFGSHHEAGAHFLFADGYSRFLLENLRPADFHALATRDDGKVPAEY